MSASGARPAEAMDEASAAQAVREMFDSIAPRYDLLNHLLSATIEERRGASEGFWGNLKLRFSTFAAELGT
jgi:hypothetical protein